MRKAITLLLLGAFCITLFSPPIAATQWDPKHPPPYLQVSPDRPDGDDTGWQVPTDENQNNPNNYQISGKYNYLTYIVIKIISIIDTQVNNDHTASSQIAEGGE